MKGEKALNGVVLICSIKAQLHHRSTREELLPSYTRRIQVRALQSQKKELNMTGFKLILDKIVGSAVLRVGVPVLLCLFSIKEIVVTSITLVHTTAFFF